MPTPQTQRSSEIPSLSGPIFGIFLFGALALMQIINIVTGHEVLGSMLFCWISLIFDAGMSYGFTGSYKRTIEKREEWRELRWAEWLQKPLPELQPTTDWPEVERAVGALLAADIEPTLERARDWLRKEHPYGTSPEGLIDQARVELEKVWRESGDGQMPPLAERLVIAEEQARERWPQHFN